VPCENKDKIPYEESRMTQIYIWLPLSRWVSTSVHNGDDVQERIAKTIRGQTSSFVEEANRPARELEISDDWRYANLPRSVANT
jgi:hypothetical protein